VNERPPASSTRRAADEPSDRLDSWKDIAAYLKRDVSTVQRWERREGLPVHRHLHDKLGSAYAFRSELDSWSKSRRLRHEQKNDRAMDTEAASSPSGAPENGVASRVGVSVLSQAHSGVGKPRWTRWWVGAAGLTALAVGTVAYGLHTSRVADVPVPEIKSLVVLPLENLSGDPAQEFFAAGMTEELIGSLAQIRALRVVSRTSAMSLKGSTKSVPTIARELNVDAVLEGSVQRSDGRVKIWLQLLHAPTDTHLWAHDYERELTDVLRLQNEVARAVAEEIRIQITPAERARMASVTAVNPAAHEEYLLGRFLLWKFIEEDRLRAIDHFNRATQIDPGYAAPYAGLAHAWWMRGVLGPLSLKEVGPPARAAARKALELDDRLAEAYAAQAYVQGIFDWDWAGAEETIRRAVELDPNSLDAHYVYAILLMALGRLPEAVTHIEHAAQLDPLSAQVHSTYGRILYRARKFDEAILRLNRAIELEPRNAQAYGRLGDVHDQIGKYVEALAFYEKSRALMANPGSSLRNRIARVYARMGRVSDSRQMLESLADDSAEVYVALGNKDTAFRLLFKMVEERSEWPIFIKADPPFDSLHSDPRWKELLRRMNFPTDARANGSR
jgi:TolB-like protein/Tfp pilus assembly protein PilF